MAVVVAAAVALGVVEPRGWASVVWASGCRAPPPCAWMLAAGGAACQVVVMVVVVVRATTERLAASRGSRGARRRLLLHAQWQITLGQLGGRRDRRAYRWAPLGGAAAAAECFDETRGGGWVGTTPGGRLARRRPAWTVPHAAARATRRRGAAVGRGDRPALAERMQVRRRGLLRAEECGRAAVHRVAQLRKRAPLPLRAPHRLLERLLRAPLLSEHLQRLGLRATHLGDLALELDGAAVRGDLALIGVVEQRRRALQRARHLLGHRLRRLRVARGAAQRGERGRTAGCCCRHPHPTTTCREGRL